MTQALAGTFSTGNNVAGLADQQSGVIDVPYGVTTGRLTTVGCDANNKIRLYKSTDNGNSWSTVITISVDQTNAGQAVAAGEQYQMRTVVMQSYKSIQYKLSVES